MPPARRQPGMQAAANANANAVNPDERLAGGSNGYTPLLFAARVGDIESARLLINAGANVNDVDALGLSPLVLSTVRGFPEFAAFLLDQGANPHADDSGFTALHWAAGTWESELTVRAITTEREDGEWYTVAGLKEGKLELVNALLKHGADPNAQMWKAPERAGSSKNPQLRELWGATPLILAAMAGNAEVMKALVAGGADPTIKTWSDGTVLMAAAGLGHVQGEDLVTEPQARAAAEAALSLGNAVTDVDAAGNTPLHYASYMRHDSVVQLLLDRGAPLNAKNKFGETPLWTSALVVQFAGGGTYQLIPSPATEILKKAGAEEVNPVYARARPTDWPDNARSAADQVADPEKEKAAVSQQR
jgi:ankyrin repeat protein